ncbi:glycosyltransferase family 4 protein [Paraburkholderia panacisoli]|uniref:Glycosyltransferase family 4 protein n=1 Tax=Paraburkholderia panacisoli TaxID=2603818 RepID=A0A5B0GZK8_9BURK|nr:glycosyltransferase family 4 protein [Paraburkholderia panacisoli]KAA1008230.1 glycosyltransferase family 4 protein [Paraburkholderia panacisoli]
MSFGTRNELARIQTARERYWSMDFEGAFSQYLDSFNANPKAWWLAMEAIRCKRALTPGIEKEKNIIFSPNYAGNSYQRNLYDQHNNFEYQVGPVNKLELDNSLVMATYSKRLVFHQHWLKELYWGAPSLDAGVHAIDHHIGILKALKSFGATVCWTLHNLIDHDANACQEILSNYAVRKMANVSDHIFIHTRGAGELLSSHCDVNLAEKFRFIDHPLYDDIQRSTTPCLPKEINPNKLQGRRILMCLGMIRPYKGVPDLIEAFSRIARENPQHSMHLVIAGYMGDPAATVALTKMEPRIREHITLVGRKLDENEMAGLMEIADVSVTPYRKILTSGSFYLATTYKKPTIAPRIGMFTEAVQDNETGFLYDGSVEGLSDKLSYVCRLPKEMLTRVGTKVWGDHQHLTIRETSTRFFSTLEAGR